MFILELFDRDGAILNEGDYVAVSNSKNISFFAEVKYIKEENIITPFHTFSFSSFKKVDKIPGGAVRSSETRYNIFYMPNSVEDPDGKHFEKYLMDWRQCEHLLRCFKIKKKEEQLTLF